MVNVNDQLKYFNYSVKRQPKLQILCHYIASECLAKKRIAHIYFGCVIAI